MITLITIYLIDFYLFYIECNQPTASIETFRIFAKFNECWSVMYEIFNER